MIIRNSFLQALINSAPSGVKEPNIAIFTPGEESSAYFEHAYLAKQMGTALVEAKDLVLKDGYLQMHADGGLKKVDVIYRRGDKELFDSLELGGGYASGTAAIADLCQQGKLALVNALGTGVADDKVIYGLRSQDYQLLFGRRTNFTQCSYLFMLARRRSPVCSRTSR